MYFADVENAPVYGLSLGYIGGADVISEASPSRVIDLLEAINITNTNYHRYVDKGSYCPSERRVKEIRAKQSADSVRVSSMLFALSLMATILQRA